VFVLTGTDTLYAEETKKPVTPAVIEPVINPKFLKLTAKKICRVRKVKSKDEFQETAGGIDYNRDDKNDNVKITVTIDNRNKIDISNYTLVVEIYGKSATERRPLPKLFKDFAVFIPELTARKKYIKAFEVEMLYDKSEDVYEENTQTRGSNIASKRIFRTPAFGQYFYGYKVTLLDNKEKVVNTLLWPSSLKKALEKMKLKEEKEKTKK